MYETNEFVFLISAQFQRIIIIIQNQALSYSPFSPSAIQLKVKSSVIKRKMCKYVGYKTRYWHINHHSFNGNSLGSIHGLTGS